MERLIKKEQKYLTNMKVTNCKVCKGKEIEVVKEIAIFDISSNLARCRNCGFVFVSPQPPLKYLQRYYDERYYDIFSPSKEQDNFLRRILKKILFQIKFCVSTVRARSQVKYILKKLNFDVKENKYRKVLDVGCGNCALLAIFHKLNWQIFGLEPNRYFANHAREHFKFQNIFTGRLNFHGLSGHKFDLITICHILEHAMDPISLLQGAKDLLKEDGIIFLEVRSIHDKSRNIFEFMPRDELYFFSKNTLSKMLEKNNFSLISIDAVDTVELTMYPVMEKIKRGAKNVKIGMLLTNIFFFMKISIIVFLAYVFKYDHARFPKRGENIAIRALVRS